MITPKITTLFKFIEFLHSNIDNFNLNNDLIKELELLIEERSKVTDYKTFKDKLQYNEIQSKIENNFVILQNNTSSLIEAKAKALKLCDFDSQPNYSFYSIETDIDELKDGFNDKDLPEIFKHKQHYIEYRTKTHKTFLSLEIFFDKLDKVTKRLFDYFKETKNNEFEAFETKATQVHNLSEAVKLFQQGTLSKFMLPNNHSNPSTIQYQINIEPLNPQQTKTVLPTINSNKAETKQKIKAPVVKLFCAIVHQCKLIPKDIDESPQKFITKVINEYSINANPNRARQYFDAEIDITKKDQKIYLPKVVEQILPNIDPTTKKQIINYLQSKNLYA